MIRTIFPFISQAASIPDYRFVIHYPVHDNLFILYTGTEIPVVNSLIPFSLIVTMT